VSALLQATAVAPGDLDDHEAHAEHDLHDRPMIPLPRAVGKTSSSGAAQTWFMVHQDTSDSKLRAAERRFSGLCVTPNNTTQHSEGQSVRPQSQDAPARCNQMFETILACT